MQDYDFVSLPLSKLDDSSHFITTLKNKKNWLYVDEKTTKDNTLSIFLDTSRGIHFNGQSIPENFAPVNKYTNDDKLKLLTQHFSKAAPKVAQYYQQYLNGIGKIILEKKLNGITEDPENPKSKLKNLEYVIGSGILTNIYKKQHYLFDSVHLTAIETNFQITVIANPTHKYYLPVIIKTDYKLTKKGFKLQSIKFSNQAVKEFYSSKNKLNEIKISELVIKARQQEAERIIKKVILIGKISQQDIQITNQLCAQAQTLHHSDNLCTEQDDQYWIIKEHAISINVLKQWLPSLLTEQPQHEIIVDAMLATKISYSQNDIKQVIDTNGYDYLEKLSKNRPWYKIFSTNKAKRLLTALNLALHSSRKGKEKILDLDTIEDETPAQSIQQNLVSLSLNTCWSFTSQELKAIILGSEDIAFKKNNENAKSLAWLILVERAYKHGYPNAQSALEELLDKKIISIIKKNLSHECIALALLLGKNDFLPKHCLEFIKGNPSQKQKKIIDYILLNWKTLSNKEEINKFLLDNNSFITSISKRKISGWQKFTNSKENKIKNNAIAALEKINVENEVNPTPSIKDALPNVDTSQTSYSSFSKNENPIIKETQETLIYNDIEAVIRPTSRYVEVRVLKEATKIYLPHREMIKDNSQANQALSENKDSQTDEAKNQVSSTESLTGTSRVRRRLSLEDKGIGIGKSCDSFFTKPPSPRRASIPYSPEGLLPEFKPLFEPPLFAIRQKS